MEPDFAKPHFTSKFQSFNQREDSIPSQALDRVDFVALPEQCCIAGPCCWNQRTVESATSS